MILTKYILKEFFKNQLIILIILFFVCVFQKLIKLLGLNNNFSIHSVILYLVLIIPELGKLIIPFSLFFSVIITYYQLHTHNEILAMYSCAIKKSFFIQITLLYSVIVACLAFFNMSWLSPCSEQYRNKILFEIKQNTYFNKLIEKKFQIIFDKTMIVFINDIKNTTLKNIFIVNKKKTSNNNIFSIIIADQGDLYYKYNHIDSISLKTGTFYEIPYNQTISSDIYVMNFSQNHIYFDYQTKLFNQMINTISNMSMSQLLNAKTIETKIEFSWRITLIISILILPLIALLLMVDIAYNYLSNFLFAIILYISFFISQILLRSFAVLHYPHCMVWMWFINFIYFIMIFLINLWKNFRFKILLKNFLYFFEK